MALLVVRRGDVLQHELGSELESELHMVNLGAANPIPPRAVVGQPTGQAGLEEHGTDKARVVVGAGRVAPPGLQAVPGDVLQVRRRGVEHRGLHVVHHPIAMGVGAPLGPFRLVIVGRAVNPVDDVVHLEDGILVGRVGVQMAHTQAALAALLGLVAGGDGLGAAYLGEHLTQSGGRHLGGFEVRDDVALWVLDGLDHLHAVHDVANFT